MSLNQVAQAHHSFKSKANRVGLFKRSKKTAAPSPEIRRHDPSYHPLSAPLQLITGKGGVGRTTVTINLGRALATRGQRILLLEVRDAESELGERNSYRARADSMLGRAIAQEQHQKMPYELGPEPSLIEPNVWAAQLVASVGHERFLSSIIPSERLVRAALESKALARFLRSAPSMHELGIYYHLTLLQSDERFDHVIVDLPASGHTLALTQLPERMARLLKRGSLVDALREGVAKIADPEYAALWVVTLPEELPVSEALELERALRKDGVPPTGVILNRALPRDVDPSERDLMSVALDLRHGSRPDQPDEQLSLEDTLDQLLATALAESELRARLEPFSRQLVLPELSAASKRTAHISTSWLST